MSPGFTSASVYLPASRSLLFLHVPDIIIAVRGMIICLLWKLADCLSPVPEELPLKGVPLEKRHKRIRDQIQGLTTEKEETARDGMRQTAREKEARRPSYNIYLYISIHHTSLVASLWSRLVSRVWPASSTRRVEGRFWEKWTPLVDDNKFVVIQTSVCVIVSLRLSEKTMNASFNNTPRPLSSLHCLTLSAKWKKPRATSIQTRWNHLLLGNLAQSERR